MDPVSAALERFGEHFRAFLAGEARVLRIEAQLQDCPTLSSSIRAEEWGAENRAPFLIFEQAFTDEPHAFGLMADQIPEHYELLREGMAEEGTELPLAGFDAASATSAAETLALHIRAFGDSVAEHLDQPLVCWLPADIADERCWLGAVIEVVRSLWSDGYRFVIVDDRELLLGPEFEQLGDLIVSEPFAIDEEAAMEHVATLMGPPPAGRGPGVLPGAAAPDVEPPPRPGPPPPTDEAIRQAMEEAGLPPILPQAEAEELRRLVIEAAQAAGRSDEATALDRQAAACGICADAGTILEEAMMTMVLASYQLQFRRDPEAEASYRRAEWLAGEAGAHAQLAQIRLGLGFLFMKDRRLQEAADVYEQAGAAASICESNMLFMEALRLAGTCHVELDSPLEAAYCWRAAVERAKRCSPDEVRAGCFNQVAVSYMDLLRQRGAEPQARDVEALIAEVGAQASG